MEATGVRERGWREEGEGKWEELISRNRNRGRKRGEGRGLENNEREELK